MISGLDYCSPSGDLQAGQLGNAGRIVKDGGWVICPRNQSRPKGIAARTSRIQRKPSTIGFFLIYKQQGKNQDNGKAGGGRFFHGFPFCGESFDYERYY